MLTEFLRISLGLNTFILDTLSHMLFRGIIIYAVGITITRFNKKLLGVRTPFNFTLFVIFGSMFAAAIINEKLFLPIICTMLLLVVLNGSLTMLAYYFPAVERFAKGKPAELVRDGEVQWGAMRKNFITKRELLSELHSQLHTQDLSGVESAILTIDGTINFTVKNSNKAL